ncbi:MmcQ/YjbR family DNA-binding protein [Spirilliplanes yamanashiensis]|uniref:TfoX N-terminal domain-containing protein n=1 Tax=Spirilliplanes yamanashiensis TaxID=42233 RepID=A0A8J3YAS7_9ACTN|nr:MmcQ/YjbR family DNA-binding protein [Spirilliplanes yamanashiensis]MDP9818772.1 hypothetical protein [Spirilliplanes yamanashiensis]GIJ05226.1 hypothetical protein Sya03_45780 [Spirilliplanes yamanashiensis]
MTWAELVTTLTALPGVTPPGAGRAFGASALKVHGRIFAMEMPGGLTVKLPADRVRELIASGAGEPFASGRGAPMREWVTVADPRTWEPLAREAAAFVGGR